jgi:CheY-like chemotaxis protein
VRKPQESHPDVANVDFQMLLMNGLEVTRRIRLLCPSYTVLIFALAARGETLN